MTELNHERFLSLIVFQFVWECVKWSSGHQSPNWKPQRQINYFF